MTGGSGDDQLFGQTGADTILGGTGNDKLFGWNENDLLDGGEGNDDLYGDSGDDTLMGGDGLDLLIGGHGRDVFSFNTVLNNGSNVDYIVDFNVTEDRIRLDGSIFKDLYVGSGGTLMSLNLKVGSHATSTWERIVHNAQTGELFYDADGSGGGSQLKFAELSKGLTLTSANFFVG